MNRRFGALLAAVVAAAGLIGFAAASAYSDDPAPRASAPAPRTIAAPVAQPAGTLHAVPSAPALRRAPKRRAAAAPPAVTTQVAPSVRAPVTPTVPRAPSSSGGSSAGSGGSGGSGGKPSAPIVGGASG